MSYTYLITGATSDVGRALIERLLQNAPADTLVLAQGCGDLEKLADLCARFPGQVRPFDVDLSDRAKVDTFVQVLAASAPAPTHFIHLPGCVAECDAEREHQHKPAEIHAAQRHVKRAFTVFDILAGADAAKPACQRIAEHDDKECAKRHPKLPGAKCFFEFFQHAVHLSDRLAYIVP